MKYTIGLDPSINNTGYSVIRENVLLKYGVIRLSYNTSPTLPDAVRLRMLFHKVQDIIDEVPYSTQDQIEVVIEDFQIRHSDSTIKNFDNLKKLLYAIGACCAAVSTHHKVVMIKPIEWKGTIGKGQTRYLAKTIYQIRGSLDHNAADAIMLAHFHINRSVLTDKLGVDIPSKRKAGKRFTKKDILKFQKKGGG